MKRRMLALFLALFLGIALTGCADVQSNNGPYKMYLIAKSTTTEFWKSVFAGANAAKSEYNVDLTILGPETEEDYEEQNRLIDEARTRLSFPPSVTQKMRRRLTRQRMQV